MAGTIEELDLDVLIQSLPACRRCRECKRGCDTLLPACSQCAKAGVECIFFDHVLDEHLPRSYIASLVEHARSLEISQRQQSKVSRQIAYDAEKVPDFAYAVTGESLRYIGKFSCLRTPFAINTDDIRNEHPHVVPKLAFRVSFDCDPITPEVHHYLVDIYFRLINPYYPILSTDHRKFLSDVPQQSLLGADAFVLNMIYAISCRMVNSGESTWIVLSEHCRGYAMSFFEGITADANLETLRAVLLLALHSLVDTQTGNLGQQVALATRLVMELSTQELTDEEAPLVDDMYKVVFCLENELASALDRPATFPEPPHDMVFDATDLLGYMTSLYRVQHQFRVQRRFCRETSFEHWTVPNEPLDSFLLVALRQTEMLLSFTPSNAMQLLSAFSTHHGFESYLHPQWVFNAGMTVLRSRNTLETSQVAHALGNAHMLLARYSVKWREVSSLHEEMNKLVSVVV